VIVERRHRGIDMSRQPEIDLEVRQLRRGRQDADDRHGKSRDVDRLSDNRRIAAEATHPEPMAHDADGEELGQIVVRHEQPAALRYDAEYAKEVGRHERRRHALGLMLGPVAAHRHEVGLVDPKIFEGAARLLEVEHLVARQPPHRRCLDARHGRREGDQSIAVRIGKGTEHDRVEDAEDRRRRADA